MNVYNIFPTSDYTSFVRNQILFFINKALMISVHTLSDIAKILGNLTDVDTAFGARVILIGRDFC